MSKGSQLKSTTNWRGIVLRYAWAILLVALAALLRWRLEASFGSLPLFITFYPAVLLVASIGGGGPGILATLFSALVVDYFFLTPGGLFDISAPNELLGMGIFTGCGIFLSLLAERLRHLRWIEVINAARQFQLEELSRLNEELSRQSEELSQQSEELSQQSEELAQQNEELSQQSEELAQQNEELQTQSEEIQSLNTELTHREDMLQKLLDAARLGAAEETVMREICAKAQDMFGPSAAAIVVYEVRDDRLLARAHVGFDSEDACIERRPLEHSFAELIIAENKTACLPDASLRPDLLLIRPREMEPFQAVLGSPIRSGGKPCGVVAIYCCRKQQWTAEQFRLAEWLAAQCGAILDTLRLQVELRRLYEEQQMIFDSVPAMIWYKDTKNNFVRVNRAVAASVGLPKEAIEGKNASEIFPEEAAQYYRDDLDVLNSGQPKLGIVEKLQIAGGEKRWITTDKIPYRDEKGNIIGVLVLVIDVTERKQAEAALRASEERLRFALQKSRTGGWELDLVNHTALRTLEHDRIFGYDSLLPQWTYEMFLDHVLPEDREMVDRSFRKVTAEKSDWNFECRIRRCDGCVRWIWATGGHQHDPSGQVRRMAGIVQDITERKQAEVVIQESEERFRTLVESAPDAIFIQTAGRFAYVNAAAVQLFGASKPEELLSEPVLARFHPDFREIVHDRIRRLNEERLPVESLDEICLTLEGTHKDVNVSAVPFKYRDENGALVFVRDISERKQAEEALRENEERFRQMFEHIRSGVGIYKAVEDGADFIVQEFNTAAELSVKLPRAEVLGRRLTQVFPSMTESGLLEQFQRVWRTGIAESHAAQQYRDDRMTLWFENYVFKLPSGDIVAIFDDISEQIRTQEHVELLRQELMHAGRLTAMGELASGIAHEINQPLTIVSTWADVVKREIREKFQGDNQESLLALNRISDAIARAGNIVHRMKSFARKSEMQKAVLSLPEAVEEVFPLVEHELRMGGVETTIDLDASLPPVLADQAQIQQVLLNLIRNAHDAMANVQDGVRKMEIRGRVIGNALEVSLFDTGCGIQQEVLEKIFEPFHTTKPDGMGLGLSICRTIIENHGGKIWAQSHSDVGTRVAFTLPLAETPHPGLDR